MKKKIKKILKVTIIVIIVLGGIIMIINELYSSANYKAEDVLIRKIKNSPQFKNGRFVNKNGWKKPSIRKSVSTMWDFMFSTNQRKPNKILPIKRVNMSFFNNTDTNHLSATWLGHSSLMINMDSYKILIDPVFEKKVSPIGPTRFNGDIPLDINSISQIDIVLISHNHYDHLNKFSIQQLEPKTSKFIVPLGIGAQLEKWGVDRSKIIELDWWDEFNFNENLMIASTPSQHFSGRAITDRDKTLWTSWVIKSPNHKIFFSGDSGYFEGFKEIGDKYGPFNMTFIECGAYNEDWHHIHMFPEETVQAHIDLKGKILHPIHWATFNLSLHAWNDPMIRLDNAAIKANVKIVTPIVGETTIYNKYIPQKKWWEQKKGEIND